MSPFASHVSMSAGWSIQSVQRFPKNISDVKQLLYVFSSLFLREGVLNHLTDCALELALASQIGAPISLPIWGQGTLRFLAAAPCGLKGHSSFSQMQSCSQQVHPFSLKISIHLQHRQQKKST